MTERGNKDQIRDQNCDRHYGTMNKDVNGKVVNEEFLNNCEVEKQEKGEEEVDSGMRRHPSTGARLWGRVRNTLLRQKVMRTIPHPLTDNTSTHPLKFVFD